MNAESVIKFYREKSDEGLDYMSKIVQNSGYYYKNSDLINVTNQFNKSTEIISAMKKHINCVNNFKIMYQFNDNDLEYINNNFTKANEYHDMCTRAIDMCKNKSKSKNKNTRKKN